MEEEVFGINLDVDSKELRQQLSPPWAADERAVQLMECLVDAVSLPGKTNQSSEDDLGANIHSALAELVATNRLQGSQNDDVRKDLKWKNQNRQVLRSIKTESQLAETLKDVMEIRDRTLRNLNARQKTILSPEPKDPLVIDAWSNNGYVSVISRRSIDHYTSLLQHLILVSSSCGWDEAQREIDFYVKEWALIRSQCLTRLMALTRIYVCLRDGADAKWLNPILEAEKVRTIHQSMRLLQAGGNPGRGGAGGSTYVTIATHLHMVPTHALSSIAPRAEPSRKDRRCLGHLRRQEKRQMPRMARSALEKGHPGW